MRVAAGRFVTIWTVATLLMVPAFASGHIISDNSFSNVNWSQGFAQELFSGHLYPRWLPAMNEGAGSPVFYFYGPLPFYLTAPFHLIAGPRFAVLLGMWLMLGLSGQSFCALAANFVRSTAALTASAAYMAMPYHLLVDVWLRSDFGELAAYIFIPLCLLGAFRLAAEPAWTFGLAASLAGLLLSHLPTALLFAPFLAGICIYIAWQGNFATVMVRAATAACLGLGLAAAYIVPAILLQGLIHASNWEIYRPTDNLLFNGRAGGFDYFLDFSAVETVTVATIFAVGSFATDRKRQTPWTILAVVTFFLTSPAATYMWNAAPAVFDKIQFPWRVLSLLDIATCMLFALTLEAKIWRQAVVVRLMLYGLIAVTTLFAVYQSRDPAHGFARRSAEVEDYLITARVEPLEYIPSCLMLRKSEKLIRIADSIVKRSISQKVPDELGVFYYPFLAVYIDGKRAPTRCNPATGFIDIGPHHGNIDVVIHSTHEEQVGNDLTLTSLLIFLAGAISSSRTRLLRLFTKMRNAALSGSRNVLKER